MKCTMKKLLIVAVAGAAFMSVAAASGQTTPPFTYTSTGVESAWTHADAWDCVDDLNRPCSGQPDFPKDKDHMVVIKNAVILDLNGQNLEIGQMDIVEDGTTGSLTVENTGGGSPRLIVNASGLLSGAIRVADGSTLAVECGAGIDIDDALTVEPGGTVLIKGSVDVYGNVYIQADAVKQGQMSVVGDCAELFVGGNASVHGLLEIAGDGLSPAVSEVQGAVTIQADADAEGLVAVGDGTDLGTLVLLGPLVIEATEDRQDFGVLDIEAGNVVLDHDNSSPNRIGGSIWLRTGLSALMVMQSMSLEPFDPGSGNEHGEVRGSDDFAQMLVGEDGTSANVTLTSYVKLAGAYIIDRHQNSTGAATLKNLHAVVADESGMTLKLGPNLALQDGDTAPYGQWAAIATGATLEFNRSAAFNGDFGLEGGGLILVKSGTAQDPKEVVTTGTVQPDPTDPQEADGCIEAEHHACFRLNYGDPFQQKDVCNAQEGVNCP